MWSVLVVLYLWVVRCAVPSSLPSPVNVVFSSVNLKNVLQWSPGSGTPDDTHFTVKYAIYGDSLKDSRGKQVYWRDVRHCKKTAYTRCDLSNETWDLEQGYYAKVRAVGSMGGSSDWTRTVWRFDPLSDTRLGPPLLFLEIKDNNAIITVKGPMRYQPNNRTLVVSMATFYPQMTYNLSIHNKYTDQMHHILLDTNTYTYRMMDYNTVYCFSAKTRVADMPIHCHASEWSCRTTPKDPVIEHLLRVIVGIVVPSLCVCFLVVICYYLCNYLMGKGRKSPYVLNPPSFHSSPLQLPENPNITVITIVPAVQNPAYIQNKHNTDCSDPLPTYSSASSTESDDSSLDYGALFVDSTRAEGDWNELKGKRQTCEVGNSCGKKDGRAEGGFYSGQAKPQLPVKSSLICQQTHTQAHTWSQLHSGLMNKIQMSREDRDCQGLVINKNPQTRRFNIPSNLQRNNDLAMGNDLKGKVTDAKFEEDADRGSKDEKVPLLSRYAFQNKINMRGFDTEMPHFLVDDNDIARLGAVDSEEADDDPDTRRLVVPETAVEFNEQRGGEAGRESGDMLRLENVFFRQSSEEAKEAEALGRMGTAGVPECAMDDFTTRWKLVISEDH